MSEAKTRISWLLRDMMQLHRGKISADPDSQGWDTQWIEQFTAGLFYEADAPMQPYLDWLSVIDSQEEEDSALLVTGLAKQLNVDPKVLYAYQVAACQVTLEDTLSP